MFTKKKQLLFPKLFFFVNKNMGNRQNQGPYQDIPFQDIRILGIRKMDGLLTHRRVILLKIQVRQLPVAIPAPSQ
jgi:hypothetical protein